MLKRFFDFLRSVDMLIWALFLTRAFGPGPLAGIGAIFLTETGTLGKLYSEGLENIDNKPREGVNSTGASTVLVQRYGVIPQILPVIVSQTLYQWESNVRGATIIGAVGAGGIGLKLWEAMRTNSNWENVAYMVLLILIVVFLFDWHLERAAPPADGRQDALKKHDGATASSSFCHGNLLAGSLLAVRCQITEIALPVRTISRITALRYALYFTPPKDDPLTGAAADLARPRCLYRRNLSGSR